MKRGLETTASKGMLADVGLGLRSTEVASDSFGLLGGLVCFDLYAVWVLPSVVVDLVRGSLLLGLAPSSVRDRMDSLSGATCILLDLLVTTTSLAGSFFFCWAFVKEGGGGTMTIDGHVFSGTFAIISSNVSM